MKKLIQIYGVGFHSPLIIYSLIPTQQYAPVLLISQSPADIKAEITEAKKLAKGKARPLVILAVGLNALKVFLKNHHDELIDYKVLLFDFPSLLLPFHHPTLQWLDCDHQAGGAWQITKLQPEALEEYLHLLSFFGDDGLELVTRMTRFVPEDRVSEIEKFSLHLPNTYKELLSSANEEKPLELDEGKDQKDWKKETLFGLLLNLTEDLPRRYLKTAVHTVLNYILGKITKREYNMLLNDLVKDDAFKKKVVFIRKWMDSKSGHGLYYCYQDFLLNHRKRSIATILEFHGQKVDRLKKAAIHPEDLNLLLSFQPPSESNLKLYVSELGAYEGLPADEIAPVEPYWKDYDIDKIFSL